MTDSMVLEEKKEVIGRLNYLRGMFAVLIVIGHCGLRFENEPFPLVFIHKFNMIGVCFFLYASGLSLSYNCDRKPGYLERFISNKIGALAAIALLSRLVDRLLCYLLIGKPFVLDITIVTEWNWYISEMIVFYLSFYILWRFVDRVYLREVLLLAVTLVVCLATLYFYKYGSWTGWKMEYYISAFSFSGGVFVNDHYTALRSRFSEHRAAFCTGLVFSALVGCASMFMREDTFIGGIVLRNLVGLSLVLLLTCLVQYIEIRRAPLVGKIIAFLTGQSTEIYLYQFCVLDIVAQLYARYGREVDWLYVVVVVVITCIVARIMVYADRYIIRKIKRV